jgi:zinc transport system substrate-binding protein
MRRARHFFVPLCLGLLLSLTGAAFAESKLRILTSVFPLKEFAAAIAGDRGEAAQLLPPGAGVHTWQPRPGDIVSLASTDLFIAIGSGLEPWLTKVVAAVPGRRLRVLEVSRGLDMVGASEEGGELRLHEYEHGPVDPHIWLDFGLDLLVADRIAAALSEIDPRGAADFQRNAAALKGRLRELDSRFAAGLKDCAGKHVVVAGHAAFGYLAHRYGLVQTALYGLSPDSQPRPKQMMRVVDFCRRAGIRTVYFENSVSPELARTLASEIGGRVLVLNAGHNLTRDQLQKGLTFFAMMEENLRSLREGLGCR